MKLKHILLTAVMALFAVSASATSAEELKIYINPGHGSWGPNNRHMATIGHSPISTTDPDTTDFFESNTNLVKCLAIFHRLCDYGLKNDSRNGLDLTQNVVMSRVKNGPYPYEYIYEYKEITDSIDPWGNQAIDTVLVQNPDNYNAYNRTLSEIATEVETFGADMMISVHSNAATDGNTVNYLYFAYDGYGSDTDKNAISTAMSLCGWNHRILERHTMWTHYDYTMTATDVANGKGKIGAQKLGVMNHSVPGYLVEGYFHTYQPARHKAMNFDVDHIEGLTYARGVADYYGLTKETTGDIYGVVRDHHDKFSDDLYSPNASTYDVYRPLNGVEVTLWQGETEVAKVTTDVNYNGAFVFKDLTPGDYTVTFSHADYMADSVWTSDAASEEPAAALAVTVNAAEVTYPTAFIENKAYTPPTTVYVNYPDSTAGKGYTVFPQYETKATAYDLLATQLEGKTVRRQLLREDRLYVLALDASNEPYVYVADLAGDSIITLGTTAAAGDIYKISDIALTADGYLVGINKANQAYGGTMNINGYKWENNESGVPTGELSVWWTNNFAGNWSNGIGGESMIYSGTLASGKMIYTGTTTGTGGNTRLVICTISDGNYLGYMRNNQDGTYIKTGYLGETYEMTLSPRADDQIIFNSAQVQPFEIKLNETDTKAPTILAHLSEGLLEAASTGEHYFKYADRDFMVAPAVADGNVTGIKMLDITDGLASATEIAIEAEFDATAYTYVSAHGELALTLSTDELTTGATIELFLAVDGKVTKFEEYDDYTTVSPETGTANPYAYALKSEFANNKLSISYSLNAAAADVNIYVKDESDGVVATYAAGELVAGAHTAEIETGELEEGTYTWEIEVAGAEKTAVETFASYRFYHPRGVDVDNNMESPSFGNIYVTEGMTSSSTTYHSNTTNSGGLGLYAFNAAVEPIINEATGKYGFTGGWTLNQKIGSSNGADLARVRVAEDGRLFVTRMSNAGNYIMYAPSFEDLAANNTFTSLFDGLTLDTSTYKYSDASGNFMAAANLGFDIKGSGEDLKMIALSANSNLWSFVYSGGSTDEYALGNATSLPVPTNVPALTGKYTIAPQCTNVEYDDRGGIWYCQMRQTPTEAQPGLVYIDKDGNEKYKDLIARGGGGVRVSPDGTRIAIAIGYNSGTRYFGIYDLVWAEDGTPALNMEYKIDHGIGRQVYDIAWDLAGNIYICGNSGEYMKAFALPRTEPFTTKAASKYAFTVVSTGIDNIEETGADAAPVYYNLQGVQVENPENGIYIVKRGNKVTKEYIRK